MNYLLIFEDGTIKRYSKELTESDYDSVAMGELTILSLEGDTVTKWDSILEGWVPVESAD